MDFKQLLKDRFVWILILWGIVTFFVYLLIPEDFVGPFEMGYWDYAYIFFLGAPVMAAGALLVLSITMGPKSQEGRFWLLLFIGMLCWVVGEFMWFYYSMVALIDPFPSPADVAYIAGYIFFAAGLIYKAVNTKVSWSAIKVGIIAVIVILVAAITIVFNAVPVITDSGAWTTSGEPLSADDAPYYYFTVAEGQDNATCFMVAEDGAYDVGENATIVMYFSEEMDHSSVENNFYLTDDDGNEWTGTFEWNGTTATITPDQNLTLGMGYETYVYAQYSTVEKFVSLLYPVMDIVLIALALYILMAFFWGAFTPNGWIIISIGVFLMTIADIIFTAMDWQGLYYPISDVMYTWSYIGFAVGAIYQIRSIRELLG